jgi:hypothetical protein
MGQEINQCQKRKEDVKKRKKINNQKEETSLGSPYLSQYSTTVVRSLRAIVVPGTHTHTHTNTHTHTLFASHLVQSGILSVLINQQERESERAGEIIGCESSDIFHWFWCEE